MIFQRFCVLRVLQQHLHSTFINSWNHKYSFSHSICWSTDVQTISDNIRSSWHRKSEKHLCPIRLELGESLVDHHVGRICSRSGSSWSKQTALSARRNSSSGLSSRGSAFINLENAIHLFVSKSSETLLNERMFATTHSNCYCPLFEDG